MVCNYQILLTLIILIVYSTHVSKTTHSYVTSPAQLFFSQVTTYTFSNYIHKQIHSTRENNSLLSIFHCKKKNLLIPCQSSKELAGHNLIPASCVGGGQCWMHLFLERSSWTDIHKYHILSMHKDWKTWPVLVLITGILTVGFDGISEL